MNIRLVFIGGAIVGLIAGLLIASIKYLIPLLILVGIIVLVIKLSRGRLTLDNIIGTVYRWLDRKGRNSQGRY